MCYSMESYKYYYAVVVLMNFNETLVTIIIVALLFTSVYIVRSKSCEAKARDFQDREYTILAGCMVKYSGYWVPLENWRYNHP